MKNKDLNWEGDNNDRSTVGITIEDIHDFKKKINRSNRFVFIGDVYINLDNVAYIMEKDANPDNSEVKK